MIILVQESSTCGPQPSSGLQTLADWAMPMWVIGGCCLHLGVASIGRVCCGGRKSRTVLCHQMTQRQSFSAQSVLCHQAE